MYTCAVMDEVVDEHWRMSDAPGLCDVRSGSSTNLGPVVSQSDVKHGRLGGVQPTPRRAPSHQYLQDGDSPATKLVFTTESIENIPAGWRARETYIVHGPEEFEEVFELAEAGKPFELYSRARLKRVK